MMCYKAKITNNSGTVIEEITGRDPLFVCDEVVKRYMERRNEADRFDLYHVGFFKNFKRVLNITDYNDMLYLLGEISYSKTEKDNLKKETVSCIKRNSDLLNYLDTLLTFAYAYNLTTNDKKAENESWHPVFKFNTESWEYEFDHSEKEDGSMRSIASLISFPNKQMSDEFGQAYRDKFDTLLKMQPYVMD